MLNSTPALPTSPVPGLPPNSAAPADSGDGQGFAQALDRATTRQRQADAEANEPAARDARPDRATERPGSHTETRPAGAAAGNRNAPARKASAAEPAATAQELVADELAGRADIAEDERKPGIEDDGQTPPADLAAWVSSLPLPKPAELATAAAPPPTAEALARLASQAIAAGDPAAAPVQGLERKERSPRDTGPVAAPELQAAGLAGTAHRPGETRGARPAAAPASELAARQAAAGARAETPWPGPGLAPSPTRGEPSQAGPGESAAAPAQPALPAALSALSTLGSTSGAPGRLAEGSAPAQAEVRAPMGSPEFAPALGSQLSVLVRDGIDHAQLKLNPAEMGPIEVRISLDGTQAQVDFSAAHAATRQALQEAVPALASALRENGLTLTGGGVFEQPRDPRGDARQPSPGPWSGGEPASGTPRAAPTPAARAAQARGVVDLYA